ncbi:hypothetical protein JAAARDRAFT_580269 [Jaapia argillacea MUCL 33604]|uniref:Uncharacterized protein n=1 Tax=Jaapia argillacea MUCL 33604 TaxID=933084 RepID=A0A067P740_9AGAM|nr:hypothetical protein JAAARDRAFT_580269 [Jaapia argillacea MUCL 33604]
MQELTRASFNADVNAPKQLTLKQRTDLLGEPEIVALVEKRQLLLRQATDLTKSLRHDDSPENDDTTKRIAQLKKEAAQVSYRRQVILAREMVARLGAARAAYFKGVSGRELRGELPVVRAPMAASSVNVRAKLPPPHVATTSCGGKENHNLSTIPLVCPTEQPIPKAPLFVTHDPIAELVDALYNYVCEDTYEHLTMAVTTLLGLPEHRTNTCYNGESPTLENTCPVCGVLCTSPNCPKGVPFHIHHCIQLLHKEYAQDVVDALYQPSKCLWDGCMHDKVWTIRTEFADHVSKIHVLSLHDSVARQKSARPMCQWTLAGSICGVEDHEDWDAHFALDHGINVRHRVRVNHCVICGLWYVSHQS